MVNTLRITSAAAVILAALVLASVLAPKWLVGYGVKHDARLDRILGEPNAADRAREGSAGKTPAGGDQTPMLVKQAMDLAKILNPPLPPQPPTKVASKPPRGPQGPPMPQPSAKFTLVGLSYSAARPEESFAYIRFADNTSQWVRTGDEISQMTIREIRKKSILCWDGSREVEIKVDEPPNTASLLETPAGTPPLTERATVSDKPGAGASTRLAQDNADRLSLIAERVAQFQKEGNGGDPNVTLRDRAAAMSQMVSELRQSQAGSGAEPNGPRGLAAPMRRQGYRSPVLAPPKRGY